MGLQIKQWSVDKKIQRLGLLYLFGAAIVMAMVLWNLRVQGKYQKESQKAQLISGKVAQIVATYNVMAQKMVNFLSDASEETWKLKEKSDEELLPIATALVELTKGTELEEKAVAIAEFDDQYLNPLDLTLQQARKTSTTDVVLRIYGSEYTPLMEKLRSSLEEMNHEVSARAEEVAQKQQSANRLGAYVNLTVLAFVTVLAYFLSLALGRSISKPLEKAIEDLDRESKQTYQASQTITDASQEMAKASVQQAAALQETAASVQEMSSMIAKSATNAAQSGEAAKKSGSVAHKGKEVVGSTVTSIQRVSTSNEEIVSEVEKSNQKFSEITKIIREIADKTKVINDIVFQTKLLSFNASVEAARAGEHGKGFAVVAEEVGNLARMSGTAANEIDQMLQKSIQQVGQIIAESQQRLTTLIADGKAKTSESIKMAEDSGRVLDQIVEEVSAVTMLVDEIATAAAEQSAGVGEISKAMAELDTTNQQNSALSQNIAASAETLQQQARNLGDVVASLQGIVRGAQSGAKAERGTALESAARF